MSIKKLTKRIWYGSETTVDSEGKTVAAAPPIATNDGSEDWDLNGLVRGELYLNDNKDDPTLFCLGSDNLPKRIGGGATSGGGGIVNVDVDVKEGKGIDVKKDLVGETVIFTVSHEDTSLAVSTSNFDDLFVQNIGIDDFGHVTSIENARLATYLDERYLRKDIPDTAHEDILFDKKIGSSIFIDDWEGKGWEITAPGAATFDSLRVRSDIYVGGRIGSPSFISGFPEGRGWDLSPYTIINSAGMEETRYRLEIDDIVARGSARFYEMIISQLRGENDNVMYSGQMKVAYYDPATGRLYLDTELGVLYNPFRPGDLLEVQRYNGIPSSDNDYYITKQYELQVEEVGIGSLSDGEERLDWITFKNFVGDLSLIAKGDVLTRVDSATNSTRKGVVKITTIDELGTPHISALYGMKTNPDDCILARMGNCASIRTKSGKQLDETVGFYARGAHLEYSTIVLNTGETIEQTFTAMGGKFESLIGGIRDNMSSQAGNILVNSSFDQNTNYWTAANTVHFIDVSGEYLWMDGSFYVDKEAVADIYNDNGQNRLRIRNTYILQQNALFRLPERTEPAGDGYTYSFAFKYKVLRAGTLSAGFPGTDLYVEQQLSPSEGYQKLSKVAKWDETGNFELRFTGEILIYGVSLFNDALADAQIKLQTQIDQTNEYIKLLATKDYVDKETGEIYIHYDSQLQITAEQMSGISTKVDNINNTIESSGWITEAQGTTIFAKKDMENGSSIVNAINVGTGGILIQANRVNLNGAVSFTMLSDYYDVNGRITSAQSAANIAASDAVDAWNKAVSAASSASTANTNATNAKKAADAAAEKAVEALTAAGSIPSWAKKSSVLEAMKGESLIVGGYLNAQYITVNEIQAVKGTIAQFTIDNERLKCVTTDYGTTAKIYIGNTDSVNPNTGARATVIGIDASYTVSGSTARTDHINNMFIDNMAQSDKKTTILIKTSGGAKNTALSVYGNMSVSGDIGFMGKALNRMPSSSTGFDHQTCQLGTDGGIYYLPTGEEIRNWFGANPNDWTSYGAIPGTIDSMVYDLYVICPYWLSKGVTVRGNSSGNEDYSSVSGTPLYGDGVSRGYSYGEITLAPGRAAHFKKCSRVWYLVK